MLKYEGEENRDQGKQRVTKVKTKREREIKQAREIKESKYKRETIEKK